MAEYVIPFVVAAIISFFMTPIAKKAAIKIGAIDIPKDERRVHNKPMPLLGGLAIYISTIVATLLFLPLNKDLLSIIIGGTIIVISGVIDDIKGISPRVKLLFQIVASIILIIGDVKIDFISNPFSKENKLLYLKGFSIPLTIIWVVGITNAFNLIDGLDGLTAGIASISSLSLLFVAVQFCYNEVMIISSILAGSCLGFLPYNFNPAKIFMGDTGSLFLGFIIAAISIEGVMKSTAAIAVILPIIVLGIPIFDTTFAIFRRLLNGKSIMEADKGHLHHQLLEKGYTQKQTVLIFYLISGIFGFLAVIVAISNSKQVEFAAMIIIIIAILFASRLGIKDRNNNRQRE